MLVLQASMVKKLGAFCNNYISSPKRVMSDNLREHVCYVASEWSEKIVRQRSLMDQSWVICENILNDQ